MLNGNAQVLPKRWSRLESKDITQRFPHIYIHIKEEIHPRFGFTYRLPRFFTKFFQHFTDGSAASIVCFGKQNQIIDEEQMGEGWTISLCFYRLPKILSTHPFDELPQPIYTEDE